MAPSIEVNRATLPSNHDTAIPKTNVNSVSNANEITSYSWPNDQINLPTNSSTTNNTSEGPIAKYDVLIVGAGPAGASLACFLSSHGITGLIVCRTSTTADTPRAHITNMAAMEALRDVGLDAECEALATHGDCMMHTRWCHSMAGEEYARIYSWGNDPLRKGDYIKASPCAPCDLPQTLLEPALVRYATTHGYKCRFDTSFLSFVDNGPDGVTTTLLDDISGKEYKVHSKYLFGADGARSRIMKQLDLPLIAKPGQGVAINVLVKADLSHLIKYRQGNLHWVMQPDKPHVELGWMAIVRMVKPWNEWMFILFPKPGAEKLRPTKAEYLVQVQELIGDDTPAEILNISAWNINEIVAKEYSRDNVFCLGDAVHRHPPFNGLGSNTCIQDAFNLAWKVAYVLKGKASPNILSTYGIERQPVGQSIITRANDGFREHFRIWEALGMIPDSLDERKAILADLAAATAKGKKRRQELKDAVANTAHEFHGLGIEMNQFYSSPGIYTADEAAPFKLEGPAAENAVMHYFPSTYPGKRLPHAWLNRKSPVKPISTVDLAGKGGFTLLTGIGGEAWEEAAAAVGKELGVEVRSHSIGFGQEWVDVYSDWEALRGVGESGAILVRPDRFVAWRSQEVLGSEEACKEKLLQVVKHVLGLSTS